jgi:hypothetical protein
MNAVLRTSFSFLWMWNQGLTSVDPCSTKNGTKTMKALKKGFKLISLTNKKSELFLFRD